MYLNISLGMTSYLPGYSGHRERYETDFIPPQLNAVPNHKYTNFEVRPTSLSDQVHFRTSSQIDLSNKTTYHTRNYPNGLPKSQHGLAHKPWGSAPKPLRLATDPAGTNVIYTNAAGDAVEKAVTSRNLERIAEAESHTGTIIHAGAYASTYSATLCQSKKSRLSDIHQLDFIAAQKESRERRATQILGTTRPASSNGLFTPSVTASIRLHELSKAEEAKDTTGSGGRASNYRADFVHPSLPTARHTQTINAAVLPDTKMASVYEAPIRYNPAKEFDVSTPTDPAAESTALPSGPSIQVPAALFSAPSSTVDLQVGTSKAYPHTVAGYTCHMPSSRYNTDRSFAKPPPRLHDTSDIPPPSPHAARLVAATGKRGIEGYLGYTPVDPINRYRFVHGKDYEYKTQLPPSRLQNS